MLDEQRVKEAESNVRNYLKEGMIKRYSDFRKDILAAYTRNYMESLEVANELFSKEMSNLWVVVVSYYSMYYIANAVLYKLGYKVGSKVSHKVTADSLIVFVRGKLKKSILEDYEEAQGEALELIGRKTDEILSSFDKELEKRSAFQYETTEEIKRAKAKTSLERAKAFVFEMKKLL
jgi:uncharacterized protein (UPF0332 family)